MKKIYYHARVLRKMGYLVDTKTRIINTSFSNINQIPKPDRYYVRQLLKQGFNHQLSLF